MTKCLEQDNVLISSASKSRIGSHILNTFQNLLRLCDSESMINVFTPFVTLKVRVRTEPRCLLRSEIDTTTSAALLLNQYEICSIRNTKDIKVIGLFTKMLDKLYWGSWFVLKYHRLGKQVRNHQEAGTFTSLDLFYFCNCVIFWMVSFHCQKIPKEK